MMTIVPLLIYNITAHRYTINIGRVETCRDLMSLLEWRGCNITAQRTTRLACLVYENVFLSSPTWSCD